MINTISVNKETLEKSFHEASNLSILGKLLRGAGININNLSDFIRNNIGFVKNANLLKNKDGGSYKFTGLVAMLGRNRDGQLLIPNAELGKGSNANSITLKCMDVFNPFALAQEKPVFIVTDVISALRLNSCGLNAISIGTANVNKYLVPMIDKAIKKGFNIPGIYYHIPRWNSNILRRELKKRDIPCCSIEEEASLLFPNEDYSDKQIAQIKHMLDTSIIQ